MIYCICNNISEKEIINYINDNFEGNLAAFSKHLKSKDDCCICLKTIKKDFPELQETNKDVKHIAIHKKKM